MRSVLILFSTLVLVYCFRKLLAFLSNVRSIQYVSTKCNNSKGWRHLSIRNHPGYRVLLSPNSLGYLLPRIPGIGPGNNHFFKDKHARMFDLQLEKASQVDILLLQPLNLLVGMWFPWWDCPVVVQWIVLLMDCPGIRIPGRWAQPCSRRCYSYQSKVKSN